MTDHKLIKSTGIIGLATVTSRVLGFVRDVLFARLFGTNIYAQAFVVAFRLPNMLRDMVGEGATDAAIVPILTEYKHLRTREEYLEAARVIFNLLLSILLVLSAAGVVFAPLLVKIIAPGFLRHPDKFAATVNLTRMVFPYILLIGMVAYSKGFLNSSQYFTTPAFSPVVLNSSMIIALLVLCPAFGIKGLVAGVLIGGLFEVVIQVPPLIANGFRINRSFRLVHPIAKRIGRLLLPRALGTAVYQLSVLVDTVLASLAWIVGPGGVAALYYSNRLVQLPLAVFGISLVTAALPKMSKQVASNDIPRLKETVSFSLRTVFTIMVPASVGLMVLARPIVRVLFERGEFTAYSTAITVNALFFYAFGLFAYAGIKVLVGTYYSMGDTKTPVKTASISLIINVVLNLILMWPLKIGGLALATSIAAMVNFLMLYAMLTGRIGDIGTRSIFWSFTRICTASGIMGVFTAACARAFLPGPGAAGPAVLLRLLAIVLASGAVYLIAAYLVRVEDVKKLLNLALPKRGNP